MSKTNTRATINANIKTNGNQAITGAILNAGLNAIIDDYAEASELTNLESQVDALEGLEAYENAYIYKDSEEVVSGTSTYVYKDIDITDIEVGKTYRLNVGKVENALNDQVAWLYARNASGNLTSNSSPRGTTENISITLTIPSGATTLRIRLYASISGGCTATYTNILLVEDGTSSVVLKEDLQNRFNAKIDKDGIGQVKTENTNFISNNIKLKIDEKVVSGNGVWAREDVNYTDFVVGKTYTIKVGNIVATNAHTPYLQVRFLNSASSVISSESCNVTEWSLPFIVPTNTAIVQLRYYGSNGTAGTATDKTTFTNVEIVEGFEENKTLAKDILTSFLVPSSTTKQIAHRGCNTDAPECTASAYISARKHGYLIAENDLQLTSDGYFVMWHDETLRRIGDSSHHISDYTLAQLKQKDFGSYKSATFANERILTFEEWVKLCKVLGMEIRIDTKVEYTNEQATYLLGVVRDLGMMSKSVWYGNNATIRAIEPSATIASLVAPTESNITANAPYLATGRFIYIPQSTAITSQMVHLAHSNGFEIECFHVEYDSYGFTTLASIYAEMLRVLECGVDGITNDRYTIEDLIRYKYL